MSQLDEMSRLNILLSRTKVLAQDNENFRKEFLSSLNMIFDDMFENDVFGSEGQTDPRGDQRNGIFTVHNVEGYDE